MLIFENHDDDEDDSDDDDDRFYTKSLKIEEYRYGKYIISSYIIFHCINWDFQAF